MSIKERRNMDPTKPYFVNPPDVDHKEFPQRKEERDRKSIPVPFVETKPEAIQYSDRLERKSTYIRFQESDDVCEYDLDSKDEEWLKQMEWLGESPHVAKALLESAIDKFERLQAAEGNQNKLFNVLTVPEVKSTFPGLTHEANQDQIEKMYKYWRSLRYTRVKRGYPLGKPLLNCFETYPDPSDIFMPFHRREPEEAAVSAYLRSITPRELAHEMKLQQEMLMRVKTILANIKRREVMKKEYFRTQFAIWNRVYGQQTAETTWKSTAKLPSMDEQQEQVQPPPTPPYPQEEQHPKSFAQLAFQEWANVDPVARALSSVEDLEQLLTLCAKIDFPMVMSDVTPLASRDIIPQVLQRPDIEVDPTPILGGGHCRHNLVWMARHVEEIEEPVVGMQTGQPQQQEEQGPHQSQHSTAPSPNITVTSTSPTSAGDEDMDEAEEVSSGPASTAERDSISVH